MIRCKYARRCVIGGCIVGGYVKYEVCVTSYLLSTMS